MRNVYGPVLLLGLIVFIGACSEKLSEVEYYKSANDSFNNEVFEDAIVNFTKLLKTYPEGEYAAKSVFMIAFINANHVNNFEEAKKYYQMFIDKYPNHELVSSAEYELKTLGKDINELPIFKKLEEEQSQEADE